MKNASSVPEWVQGAVERTQCRNPVAVASCSSGEAGVAESKQRSVKWTDGRSEAPEGKASVGYAVEIEEIAACRFVGCKNRLVVSFRVWACNEKYLFSSRPTSSSNTHLPLLCPSPILCRFPILLLLENPPPATGDIGMVGRPFARLFR
jgi:hypothetical protein